MKPMRRFSGQALVEFALILPIILLIVFLFIDIARIIYFYSALNNAVREGTRYAIVTQFASSAEREANVRQLVIDRAVTVPLLAGDIAVYCDQDISNFNNPCDSYVTVAASAAVEPMTPFFAGMIGLGNTVDINTESTMQMTPYGKYKP